MTTALHDDPGPFFTLSTAPMAILSGDGTIVRANRAFTAAFPAAQGKVEGMTLPALITPGELAHVQSLLTALESGASVTFDGTPASNVAGHNARSMRFHVSRPDAGQMLLSVLPAPARGAIDDLKLTIFDRILQSGPVAYFATDAQGIYTANDGKAGARLGIAPGALVGQNSLELWKDSESVTQIERSLAGEEVHTQSSVPGIDVEIWFLPILNAQGVLTGTVGFAIDMTAQMEAERTLREKLAVIEEQKATLEMFGRVLASAPLILWGVDVTGKVTTCEGKGADALGVDPAQLIGQNAIEFYKNAPDIAGSIVRALGGEETRAMVTPTPGVHFDAWFMPLRGRDGVQGAIGLSIDATERVRGERELREKIELIERQSATIRALATPIIRIWDEVLCLPVVGTVDSARTADMMQALLEAIVRDQARFAIVDLTGVEVVDTSTADHLIQLFRAAKVLGVDGVLCGIRPAVAQTIVALGLDLGSVKTMRTLRDALRWCIRSRGVGGGASTGPVVGQSAGPGQVSFSGGSVANSNGQGWGRLASGGEP